MTQVLEPSLHARPDADTDHCREKAQPQGVTHEEWKDEEYEATGQLKRSVLPPPVDEHDEANAAGKERDGEVARLGYGVVRENPELAPANRPANLTRALSMGPMGHWSGHSGGSSRKARDARCFVFGSISANSR